MRFFFLLAVLLPYAALGSYSANNNSHYVAAVVEYSPVEGGPTSQLTGLQEVLQNVRNYEELISTAKSQEADIVVFPEAGLTGYSSDRTRSLYFQVPQPRDSVSPCLEPTKWDEPITRLSCAARKHQIYVVCNLREQSGSKRHNTNVVFDRNGVVVSRYRKRHLFNEPGVQVPNEKDFGVFHTDFGVTFGVTICFDLIFREPASELVHTRNIRHFAFSTAWFSELPFLTAVQTQAAWAWSHNSVLLASGLNVPKFGSTGSGIYAGRMGPIKTIFTDKPTTQLLVARVPKKLEITDDFCEAQKDGSKRQAERNGTSFNRLFLLKDWLRAFATQLVPLEDKEKETTLCHDEFCCHFKIRTTLPVTNDLSTSERDWQPYRFFVWNGVRDFSGAATGGVQFCAVAACQNATDITSCGKWIPADKYKKVEFSKLEIRGDFESNNNTMLLANTLNQDLLPLPADSFDLKGIIRNGELTENVRRVKMTLMKKHNYIQTFAIYNRVFDRDGSDYTHKKP